MFFYKLIVLLIYALPQTPTSVLALKCYSCGEENPLLGPEYPNPLPCEEMDKSPNFSDFIIECPNEYLGCITQIKGKEMMRTCDVLAIDDCKTANGIKYCYCSQDLCNYDIKMSRNDARKSSRDILDNYPSDDEDYDDNDDNSSGMGNNYHHNDDDNDDIFKEKDTMHREIEVILNSNSSSRNISNNYKLILIILITSLLIKI